jgi:translation initiation factor IF-2
LKKVRVFELAKEFGMRGPDLAKLLREIGFDNVKTHMTVLDDADLMMVEARLATQGLRRQPAGEDAGDGLPKKKSLAAAAELETEADAGETGEPETDSGKKPLLKKVPDASKKTLPKPLPRRGKPATGGEAASATDSQTAAPSPAAAHSQTEPAPAASGPAPTAAKAPQQVTEAAKASPATESVPQRASQPAAEAASSAPTAPMAEPAAVQPKVVPPEMAKPATPAAPAAASPAAPATAPATPPPAAVAAEPSPVVQPTAAAASDPATKAPAAAEPPPVESAAVPAAAAPTAPAAPPAAPPAADDNVRRLLVPAKRATVVGRIELPQETIRDARSRSAPASAKDLRKAALQKMQQRTGQRTGPQPGQRRGPTGPGMGRGPGRSGPGGPGGPGGMRRGRAVTSVDPNKVVEVAEPVSIKALSEALGTKVSELIATLTFKLGVAGKNINSFLSNEEVELVALELDRKIKLVEHREAMDELIEQLVEDSEGEQLMRRSPVVTFMGHVDHGKTSLMDALRQSDVAEGEAGGITQHIGAYKIYNEAGQSIVVLDTPGHAAFTAMRARGADLTDVVVLVVAGDDGVMPQTEEAINHAKAAKVPIVVAITKCDLPSSKPMQVKQQLMIKGLQAEDFGGEIGVVEVSAKTGKGLDELFERIMLESEILELEARPDAPGKGVVVESRQSPEQGVVVTLLVTDGTLRLKDQIVCGESFARVRAMIDDHGESLTEAGPSTPVTLFGLDRPPSPGDKLFVVEDAKKAREVVEERQRRVQELSRAGRGSAITLETLSATLAERKIQEIKLILKADATGSLEPLRKCLQELSTDEVRVNLVHSALGGINETDVSLASASGAIIVGFHTIADSSARQMAERADVQIRYYEVIYQLLDDVRAAMEGMLAPEEVQQVIGHAEVKAVFKSSKFGTIAGLRILDGVARRSSTVRLSRDGIVAFTGKVGSLRRIDEDVREVKAGFECGMTLDGHQDIREGDQLEFVQIELVKRTLGG